MEGKQVEENLYVTEQDMERLELILDSALQRNDSQRENVRRLMEDLDRASIIDAEDVPHDVVTMNSVVCVADVDSGEEMTFTLVYPEGADLSQEKVSVLAPVGSAVLGYRTGDMVEWKVPSGQRRLKIEKVFHQPEANGHHESS